MGRNKTNRKHVQQERKLLNKLWLVEVHWNRDDGGRLGYIECHGSCSRISPVHSICKSVLLASFLVFCLSLHQSTSFLEMQSRSKFFFLLWGWLLFRESILLVTSKCFFLLSSEKSNNASLINKYNNDSLRSLLISILSLSSGY